MKGKRRAQGELTIQVFVPGRERVISMRMDRKGLRKVDDIKKKIIGELIKNEKELLEGTSEEISESSSVDLITGDGRTVINIQDITNNRISAFIIPGISEKKEKKRHSFGSEEEEEKGKKKKNRFVGKEHPATHLSPEKNFTQGTASQSEKELQANALRVLGECKKLELMPGEKKGQLLDINDLDDPEKILKLNKFLKELYASCFNVPKFAAKARRGVETIKKDKTTAFYGQINELIERITEYPYQAAKSKARDAIFAIDAILSAKTPPVVEITPAKKEIERKEEKTVGQEEAGDNFYYRVNVGAYICNLKCNDKTTLSELKHRTIQQLQEKGYFSQQEWRGISADKTELTIFCRGKEIKKEDGLAEVKANAVTILMGAISPKERQQKPAEFSILWSVHTPSGECENLSIRYSSTAPTISDVKERIVRQLRLKGVLLPADANPEEIQLISYAGTYSLGSFLTCDDDLRGGKGDPREWSRVQATLPIKWFPEYAKEIRFETFIEEKLGSREAMRLFRDPTSQKIMEKPCVWRHDPQGITRDRSSSFFEGKKAEDIIPNRLVKSQLELLRKEFEAQEERQVKGEEEKKRPSWSGRVKEKTFEERIVDIWGKEGAKLFEDPISLDIIKGPVITPDGYTYSKESIEGWVNDNGTCPLTRKVLSVGNLKPNQLVAAQLDLLQPEQQHGRGIK